ncbi:MAG TPA: hypothetical protein GX702_14620 [Chloroflexi bacterium]|jgi:hypothetical protein|nr:hypothetical protein [Chloroflexota bacterium]
MDYEARDAASYLQRLGLTLAAGTHYQGIWGWLALAAMGFPALWEIYRGYDRQRGLLGVALLLPIAGGYLLQSRIPFLAPRFFLYLVPLLCILTATGLVRLRKLATVPALALAVAWAILLPHAYRPFAPLEENSPAGQTLRTPARPGDGVIVGYIWQERMLRLHAPQIDVAYYLGWFDGQDMAEAKMIELFATHPRLWMITYQAPLQHPMNPRGLWLERYAARALLQEHGLSRATFYLPPCEGGLADETTGRTARFGSGIVLRYLVPPQRAQPGEAIPIALEWTPDEAIPQGYAAFVQLLSSTGELVAQADGEPGNGMVPFATIAPGQSQSDCRSILIPADAAPGTYRIIAGLYQRDNGRRLAVETGASPGADHLTLAEIEIVPSE